MNKILFITYSFGFSSPVGAGAERVVKALARLGTFVYVITSSVYKGRIDNVKIITRQNAPRIPARFTEAFSNFTGREVGHIIWEIKAFRSARKILKRDPGIVAVYTRSLPISVCPIGIKIKKQYHLPLMMHFTDPIPAPIEWAPNNESRVRMIRQMKDYIPNADLISFGNRHMLQYEERTLGVSLSEKAFISQDPSAYQFITLPAREEGDSSVRLVFLGNIYGNRNPAHLFEAISNVNDKKNITLNLYGNNKGSFPSFVINRNRTNDILAVMKNADILVDIDGDDKDPVFISSKLRDYLSVNRPVLAISPKDSPSREVLEGLKTVQISSNNTAEIQEAILRLLKMEFSESDYKERIPIVSSFNPDNIAREIIQHINAIVK